MHCTSHYELRFGTYNDKPLRSYLGVQVVAGDTLAVCLGQSIISGIAFSGLNDSGTSAHELLPSNSLWTFRQRYIDFEALAVHASCLGLLGHDVVDVG